MITYDEFMKNVNRIQNNKAAAQFAVENFTKEMTRLEGIYDLQTVSGEDTGDIKDEIDDITIELIAAKSKLEAFNRKPNLVEVLKENKSIEEQAVEIMDRNQVAIDRQQKVYTEKVGELIEIKNSYLRAVRDLGAVAWIAEHYVKEQNQLKHYVRTRENIVYQGVDTGINEFRKKGVIFIDPDEVLKEFKSAQL